MSIYSNPEKNYRPKEGKFKPTPYSQGPHAHAVHDAGGKHIEIPVNRHKFNASMAAHAPGCGSPMRIEGTNGGFAKCGSTVGSEKVFCHRCLANKAVDTMLEPPAKANMFMGDTAATGYSAGGESVARSIVNSVLEAPEGSAEDEGWGDDDQAPEVDTGRAKKKKIVPRPKACNFSGVGYSGAGMHVAGGGGGHGGGMGA